MTEEKIGRVVHYWPKVQAAQIELEGGVLKIGDKVHIHGPERDVVQRVTSLQVEHRAVTTGHPGDAVAVQVSEPVHAGDEVFLLLNTGGPKE